MEASSIASREVETRTPPTCKYTGVVKEQLVSIRTAALADACGSIRSSAARIRYRPAGNGSSSRAVNPLLIPTPFQTPRILDGPEGLLPSGPHLQTRAASPTWQTCAAQRWFSRRRAPAHDSDCQPTSTAPTVALP